MVMAIKAGLVPNILVPVYVNGILISLGLYFVSETRKWAMIFLSVLIVIFTSPFILDDLPWDVRFLYAYVTAGVVVLAYLTARGATVWPCIYAIENGIKKLIRR